MEVQRNLINEDELITYDITRWFHVFTYRFKDEERATTPKPVLPIQRELLNDSPFFSGALSWKGRECSARCDITRTRGLRYRLSFGLEIARKFT